MSSVFDTSVISALLSTQELSLCHKCDKTLDPYGCTYLCPECCLKFWTSYGEYVGWKLYEAFVGNKYNPCMDEETLDRTMTMLSSCADKSDLDPAMYSDITKLIRAYLTIFGFRLSLSVCDMAIRGRGMNFRTIEMETGSISFLYDGEVPITTIERIGELTGGAKMKLKDLDYILLRHFVWVLHMIA